MNRHVRDNTCAEPVTATTASTASHGCIRFGLFAMPFCALLLALHRHPDSSTPLPLTLPIYT